MDERQREIHTKLSRMRHMLVAHATNGDRADNEEYTSLRRDLLDDGRLRPVLPQFLKECHDITEFWSFIKTESYMQEGPKWEWRRKFLREQFQPAFELLEESFSAPADDTVAAALTKMGSTYVLQAWQTALERRVDDPDGAITAARTLLESVCKHVLHRESVPYDDNADLPKLYSAVAQQLHLAPSQHTEHVFKQILGGCHTVVQGIGALRNRLGDAHGKDGTDAAPAPRHAALAVNLAGAMALFLAETWEGCQAR